MNLDGSLRWGGTPSKTDLVSRSCYPIYSWNVHGQDTSQVDINPPKAHVSILRGDVAEGAPWLEPVEIEVWRRAHFPRNSVSCSFDRLQLEAEKIFFTVVVSNENNRQLAIDNWGLVFCLDIHTFSDMLKMHMLWRPPTFCCLQFRKHPTDACIFQPSLANLIFDHGQSFLKKDTNSGELNHCRFV